MHLSCKLLVRELAQWTVSESTFVPVFGALVRYVYNHLTEEGYPIRQLVAQFATCVVEDISGLEGWSSLLSEVPRFATDLISEMTMRFS